MRVCPISKKGWNASNSRLTRTKSRAIKRQNLRNHTTVVISLKIRKLKKVQNEKVLILNNLVRNSVTFANYSEIVTIIIIQLNATIKI